MQGLTHQSCVQELKSKVEELTGIPCDIQKIMVGYPPSSLDLRDGDAHLKDYPIKSGGFQTNGLRSSFVLRLLQLRFRVSSEGCGEGY